ncbi:MAG: patatin-like phospholipase family protein, partial [Bacteroidetes bacterium]|nr:patatin-like phospholipase family protein [Bacteroidota bacterium]
MSGGGAKGFAHIGAIKVFEEAGLRFDYIGGTSMGSIIGGLYAIGYHPDTMMKIVGSQNWNNLMSDKIPRRFVPIEEKYNVDRFITTFPVRKRKLQMRQGLYNGQLIELLLAHY